MDGSTFENRTFDLSEFSLIRTEIGAATRLKRRWMIALSVVGSLALISLIFAAFVATKSSTGVDPQAEAMTLSSNWSDHWLWLDPEGHRMGNATNTINWTHYNELQYERELILERQLEEMEQRVKLLEEKVLSREKASENEGDDSKDEDESSDERPMRIPHEMEGLARNLSSAEFRLDQLEANENATKAELKGVQEKLESLEGGTRPEEEASAGTDSARCASHEEFEDQMRALRSNLSHCASDVSRMSRQMTNHSSLLQELANGDGKANTTEEMNSVISRIADQEQRMESAYAELNKQLGESVQSGAALNAAQNARIKEIKVELEKVKEKTVALEGDLNSITDSKGKCLVGKVSPPTCPSSNNCWPYHTTVTFTTTFEKVPTVVVALSKIDTNTDENRGFVNGSKDNVVVTAAATSVTAASFVVTVDGGKNSQNHGGNNHLFDADVVWVACV